MTSSSEVEVSKAEALQQLRAILGAEYPTNAVVAEHVLGWMENPPFDIRENPKGKTYIDESDYSINNKTILRAHKDKKEKVIKLLRIATRRNQ